MRSGNYTGMISKNFPNATALVSAFVNSNKENKKPFTEGDFSQRHRLTLSKLVTDKYKETGQKRVFIDYSDYDKYGSAPVEKSSIMTKLFSSPDNMRTTLGRFYANINDDGTFTINDDFDFKGSGTGSGIYREIRAAAGDLIPEGSGLPMNIRLPLYQYYKEQYD